MSGNTRPSGSTHKKGAINHVNASTEGWNASVNEGRTVIEYYYDRSYVCVQSTTISGIAPAGLKCLALH